MKKVAIIDYGAGNLMSVSTALKELELDSKITSSAKDLNDAGLLILPGVGAFPDAMKKLGKTGLIEVIDNNVRAGKPLLGICLGMQMLFDKSYEITPTAGLGYIPGKVVSFKQNEIPPGAKIPHMGWNELVLNHPEDPFLKNIDNGDYVYYVHSFYARPEDFNDTVLAWSDYKVKVPGIVRKENVIGTQFHPEKSSHVGMRMLNNLAKEFL